MKFTDLVDITHEGQRGLAYQSEDGRWRVSASDLGDPPFTWCVWQRRRATWMQRLPWLALASAEEAQGVASFLATLPLGLSPLLLRDGAEWAVRRGATAALAYASVRIGEVVMRRSRDRVVRDLVDNIRANQHNTVIIDPDLEHRESHTGARDRLSRATSAATEHGWTAAEWFEVLSIIDGLAISAVEVVDYAGANACSLRDAASALWRAQVVGRLLC